MMLEQNLTPTHAWPIAMCRDFKFFCCCFRSQYKGAYLARKEELIHV